VEKVDGKSTISKIHLVVNAVVPGIDDAKFQEIAKGTLEGCPVSRAFKGNVALTIEAKLS
jgi:osmotically inducible protein OsmC